jgi:hypothetical protein
MAITGGKVVQNPIIAQNPIKPSGVNVTNPYMQGPTQAEINARPGTSTGVRHADQLGWAKMGTQPTPYVAPPPVAPKPVVAPAPAPAPTAPTLPASVEGLNKVVDQAPAMGSSTPADSPVRLAGMGSEAVANVGSTGANMLGRLGGRRPPQESMALASLGRKVY